MLWMAEEFSRLRPPSARTPFDWIMSLQGESVRRIEKRHTFRVSLGGRAWFVKHQFGVMWTEAIKDALRLNRPILDTANEYRVSCRLRALGIGCAEPVAVGFRGPVWQRQSFLVTRALPDSLTLNQISRGWWQSPPALQRKRELIARVAEMVRVMHASGINHRDLYINHFRAPLQELSEPVPPPIYLMDLHRAQQRSRVPRRWLIKDLGSLLFSCLDKPLTRQDKAYFLKCYRPGLSLRQTISRESALWSAVMGRALALQARHQRKQKTRPAEA